MKFIATSSFHVTANRATADWKRLGQLHGHRPNPLRLGTTRIGSAIFLLLLSGYIAAAQHSTVNAQTLSAAQVAQAAYTVGFRAGALVNAVAISDAESNFVLNATHTNTNETVDRGLWQINSIHTQYDSNLLLTSATYNATAAYQISDASVDASWTPWTTFNDGAFENYLTIARNTAENIDSTVIRGDTDQVDVTASAGLHVYTNYGDAIPARTVSYGLTGTVVDGPYEATIGSDTYIYVWWKIHWNDGGSDGWSVEDYMQRTGSGPTLYQVTPYAEPNGAISPASSQSVPSGGSVTFTAIPNAGYTVDTWYVNGTLVATGGTTYTVSNVTAPTSITVFFKAASVAAYQVTPSAGSNGNISPNTVQTVNSGGSVTFTATPATNYVVNQWYVNGTSVQTGGTTFTLSNVTANTNVQVTFTAATTGNYTLTVSPAPVGGTVTISPSLSSYTPGQTVTVTATPNSGYQFTDWSGNLTGNVNPWTIQVNGNYVFTALFSAITYQITPSAGSNGTVSPSTVQTVNSGGSVTFTATPATNYVVDQWYVNGTSVQTGGTSFTLSNITANSTVEATFKTATGTSYVLTVEATNSASGVTIGVSPTDINSQGSGVPQFTRTYNSGTQVTLTAPATANGNSFLDWDVDGVETTSAYSTTVTMNAAHTVLAYYATPGAPEYSVTTSSSPTGGGMTTGEGSYFSGTNVTVTASANSGYTFSNWTENGTVVSGLPSYSFTITENVNLVANFLSICTVTPSAGSNGSISPNTAQTVSSGASVGFTATPATGYVVNQWLVNGSAAQTGGNTYTLTNVAANTTVQVTFTPQTYSVTPSAGSNGSISPNTTQTVNSGGSLGLTATPVTGYVVNQWLVNGSAAQTGGNTYTLTNVTANTTVQVTFTPQTYTVTPSAGNNGSISPNTAQTVDSGGSVGFTATPATGYVVNQWLVNGSAAQTGGNTYTLASVTANTTVQVTFTPQTYTVTPSAGSNGSISPNTTQTVNSGGSLGFTATPATGYVVNQWLVNGSAAQTGGNTYTLTNVAANTTVQVTFTPQTYSVTPSAGSNGSISPNTTQTVNSGGSLGLTATPVTGYVVNQWLVNGSAAQTGGNTYTLTNVTANTTVQVTFTPETYTVTPSAGNNGSISPNTAQTVDSGGSVGFTATPATGYVVNQWLVNGSAAQTGGNTYTLASVTANTTVQVTFTPQTYTVTPSAGNNGSISPNTAQTVDSGGSVGFTATPATGYVVNQWLVNGSAAQTGGNTYTLTNVTANTTVQVTFTPQTYSVTPSAGSNGSISPNTTQTMNSGGSLGLTATPATGYVVNQWLVNGSAAQTGGNTYTLTNVTANTTVQVTFTPQTYTVTPSAGNNGSISPNTAQTVDSGGSVGFTAAPASGYAVNQWLVNGSAVQTGGTTYTLADVIANTTIQVTFTAVNQPPNTPLNQSPANGAIGVSILATLQASEFSDPDSGATQLASEWVVTRVIDNTVVQDVNEDTADMTFLPEVTLAASTAYTWKVRYEDSHALWSEFSTPTTFTTGSLIYRPDAIIGFSVHALLGLDVYSSDGTGESIATTVKRAHSKTCLIYVQNSGNTTDTMVVHGDAGNATFAVHYYYGTRNVTNSVIAGSFEIRNLPANARKAIRAVVEPRRLAAVGEEFGTLVTFTSQADPSASDTVLYDVTAQ